MKNNKLNIVQMNISELKFPKYNPRLWTKEATKNLKESIKRFGVSIPILVNSAKNRKNIVIGGNFRVQVMKELGYKQVPAVFINLPDIEKETELNLRLNKNTGDWNIDLLAEFDEAFLADVGFSSENLDDIFPTEDNPEEFDLNKELRKLKIDAIKIKKGDIWQLGENRLMCGDSTIEIDFLKLMNGERADMCLTDPPYILDYLKAKRHGKPTEGFGAKKNRKYLETDILPPDLQKSG